jgi:hypothetical protein
MIKANVLDEDSTTIINSGNKRIIVTDNVNKQRLEVEVYELQDGEEIDSYEKVFEGHYIDGKVYERKKSLVSIDIPSPLARRSYKNSYTHIDPHYAGIGIGFARFADKGDIDNIPFRTGNSLEIDFNILEEAFPISRHYKWAVVTGFGVRWTCYQLKGNHYFKEIDDYTQVLTAPDDWNIQKSRLGITTLNVPLLLEWQSHRSKLFFSAGAVCSFKVASSSRINYKDERDKKCKEKVDSGMTLRPVTMDILVQAGLRDVGFFTRYSPISIFEKNKGPELYPLTFGAMLHF